MNREEALIGAFVQRNKRDRYREILASPRLRHKFTGRLAHFTDFDTKYRVPIPSNKLFVGNIAVELKKRTLTNLYNQRPAWLANAHRDLDEAVAAAYGWPADLSDDEILKRLLDLNLARSAA